VQRVYTLFDEEKGVVTPTSVVPWCSNY